ncbi:MAG: superfamily [Frankiales bacterium]|jgi:hypothetical protein|nr:superfamily [Frankiales bacterium]
MLRVAGPDHTLPGRDAVRATQVPVPTLASRRVLRRTAGVALRLGIAVALYLLYAYARDLHGATGGPQAYDAAVAHARHVVALQDALGIPAERDLQEPFLGSDLLVRASGAFYGSAHFLVTVGTLLWLALRRPKHFDRWFAVLAVTTFTAVLCFVLLPMAPPRLMPPGEATVDTLAVVGGLVSYDHGVLERISDPFAAMPSLHLAWAAWCALALRSSGALRVRRAGLWLSLHPALTVLTVIVTGNHWLLDLAAGAALVLLVAWALPSGQAAGNRGRVEAVGQLQPVRPHEVGVAQQGAG